MKEQLARLALTVIVGLMLGMTSCALGPDARAQRFDEEALADLVIHYSTDNTIFRLKPDGRDGVFMRIYDRDQICTDAADQPGQRYMAVVLIDLFYSPHTEREVINSWVTSLKPLNYQRVVFLRNNGSESITGLRVVADVQLAGYASNTSFDPAFSRF